VFSRSIPLAVSRGTTLPPAVLGSLLAPRLAKNRPRR